MVEGDYYQIKQVNNNGEEDGDYEQLQKEYTLDEDMYEKLEGTPSLKGKAFRATPVTVVDADDESDYAEASEVCLSMNWEDPQLPPRPTLRVAKENHRTVISFLAPEVVIIEDDPPPKRPHSADELEALLGQRTQSPREEKTPSLEGLFRATPVRLQRAQKAAHAWAQDLPDLVPAQREDGNANEEEEDTEEEDDESDMSFEEAMKVIKEAARRQPPRIASTNDGLHQAIAVKVSPIGPLEGPLTGRPVKPLSFALTDVELTLEETVDTMRSPFTSLALD